MKMSWNKFLKELIKKAYDMWQSLRLIRSYKDDNNFIKGYSDS